MLLWQHMAAETARSPQARSLLLVSPDSLAKKILSPTSHAQRYNCFLCLNDKAPALEDDPKLEGLPFSCCGAHLSGGAGDPKENNTQVLTGSEWGTDLGVRVFCVNRWSRYRLSASPQFSQFPTGCPGMGEVHHHTHIPPQPAVVLLSALEACPEWLLFSLHTKPSFLPPFLFPSLTSPVSSSASFPA